MKIEDPDGQPSDETGHHPLYKKHESDRHYPRIRLQMPVQIALPGGKVVMARIYKLSPEGFQIRCDKASALAIHPKGATPIPPGKGPKVHAVMRLETRSQLRSHVLRCRVAYVVPQSKTDAAVGLTFEELNPEERGAIEQILSASLVPRED